MYPRRSFLSIEFQQTGYLVYRMYRLRTAIFQERPCPYGSTSFFPTHSKSARVLIVGQTGWEQQLESNKQAFAMAFWSRSRFSTAFPATMDTCSIR